MSGMEIEIVAEGLGFPEGPVVMADGSVIVVELAGRIVSIASRKAKSAPAEKFLPSARSTIAAT